MLPCRTTHPPLSEKSFSHILGLSNRIYDSYPQVLRGDSYSYISVVVFAVSFPGYTSNYLATFSRTLRASEVRPRPDGSFAVELLLVRLLLSLSSSTLPNLSFFILPYQPSSIHLGLLQASLRVGSLPLPSPPHLYSSPPFSALILTANFLVVTISHHG